MVKLSKKEYLEKIKMLEAQNKALKNDLKKQTIIVTKNKTLEKELKHIKSNKDVKKILAKEKKSINLHKRIDEILETGNQSTEINKTLENQNAEHQILMQQHQEIINSAVNAIVEEDDGFDEILGKDLKQRMNRLLKVIKIDEQQDSHTIGEITFKYMSTHEINIKKESQYVGLFVQDFKIEVKEEDITLKIVTNDNIQLLGQTFNILIEKIAAQVNEQYKNNDLKVQLVYNYEKKDDEQKNVKELFKHAKIVLNDFSARGIERELYSVVNKNVESYTPANLINVLFFINKLPDAGGCQNDNTRSISEKVKMNGGYFKIHNYNSKNNNCAIAVFLNQLNIKTNGKRHDQYRKEMNLQPNTKIDYTDLHVLANYFKCSYSCVNEEYKILVQDLKGKEQADVILCLKNEHYYGLEITHIHKCESCGKSYIDAHKCNQNRANYYQAEQKLKLKMHMIRKRNTVLKPKIIYDDVVNFDFECFQNKYMNKSEVYAAGYVVGDKYVVHYGKDALKDMVDDFLEMKGKIFNAYNGSRFDNYFIINELHERNISIEKIMISGGRVLSAQFHENKLFDLCQFTLDSLERACESFKTDVSKSSFNHDLIQSWEDTEKYRDQVEPYLKLDCLSLKSLFEKFNDCIYDICQKNITDYVTLSHMAYDIFLDINDKTIELIGNKKIVDLIKTATFGGRCLPNQKEYKSEFYDDIMNKKMTYEELKKTLKYKFNVDCTSLYPSAMHGVPYLAPFLYPIGFSRKSTNPEEDYRNKKVGFFTIDYTTNKKLRVSPCANKIDGYTKWDLRDGIEQTFTNVDIENMESCGYIITKFYEAEIWDETSSEAFKEYVDKFIEIKQESEKSGNKAMRTIAKLFLNGLYGKTLQGNNMEATFIVDNLKTYTEICHTHKIKNIEEYGNKLFITAEKLVQDEKYYSKKPIQLGAFVLAYSRRIMLHFMKAIDPTLESAVFSYTDTDSLHIDGKDHQKLVDLGLCVPKSEAKLGYLCSDIDGEGLIISEKNVGPKNYTYTYTNDKNKIDTTRKCKGIPQKKLTDEMYENESGTAKYLSFQKKHTKLNSVDKSKNLTPFSIVKKDETARDFNKTQYSGMRFDGINDWFPYTE